MAISITRYVDITSGVGGATAVATRDLNGLFFTTNPLVPTDSIVVVTSASDAATYFGSTSDEYKRALFYFGWTSKNATVCNQMSFARWASADVASTIYGDVATYTLSTFTAVSTGDFTLTLGGFTHHLTAIDLTGAASLAAVAAIIQVVVRAYSAGGSAWTGATVTYNSTRKSFDFVSGNTGDDIIAVTAGATVDVASLLGWLTGAIFSNGQDEQTITDVLVSTSDASNNFGSFTFIPSLTLDEVTEAAEWNNTMDNIFLYSVRVAAADRSTWSAALSDIGGVTLTLAPLSTEYPEQVPMMIEGATNYNAVNSVQNYMFQIFDLTPSVTSDADADIYDGLGINYYGQTQTAGTLLSFYQRGVMYGLPVDPADQNTYINEIWLKDAMLTSIMTLLVTLPQIAANNTGRAILLSGIQSIITQALFNGVISTGKPLTNAQKAYITTVTNDNLAWQQVKTSGYWVDVQIEPYVESLVTKYKAVYTLLYSKDDIIRRVDGRDILI